MKKHCCKSTEYYLANEDKIVHYWNKYGEYGIPVHDGGTSMIAIEYCPWCGEKLPQSNSGEILLKTHCKIESLSFERLFLDRIEAANNLRFRFLCGIIL